MLSPTPTSATIFLQWEGLSILIKPTLGALVQQKLELWFLSNYATTGQRRTRAPFFQKGNSMKGIKLALWIGALILAFAAIVKFCQPMIKQTIENLLP